MTKTLLAVTILLCTGMQHAAPAAAAPGVLTAAAYTYAPGDTDTAFELHIIRGASLLFVNAEPLGVSHSVTSEAVDALGSPLFNAEGINPGGAEFVQGSETLAPGSYAFYCAIHYPSMTGVLFVDPPPAA